MEWIEVYGADLQPTKADIAAFIANPLWEDLNSFLQENYQVEPSYSYSSCSGQPGWNVKYQKAGRSLCTLYPMQGFFIALVVIGAKEEAEAELMTPTFTARVQGLMASVKPLSMGRWLMIHVTDEQVLDDVKRLIQLRRRITKGGK